MLNNHYASSLLNLSKMVTEIELFIYKIAFILCSLAFSIWHKVILLKAASVAFIGQS